MHAWCIKGRVTVVISLRDDFAVAEGEKHRDEGSHFTAGGQVHYRDGENSGPFHLGDGFEDAMLCVDLRLKNFAALLIGGTELGGAANASLRRNAVREFLNHNIGSVELGDVFKWALRSDCLKILMGASEVR